jgi:cardiolipin synthase
MFLTIAILCIAITAVLLLLVLFEPGLRYQVDPPPYAPESEEFLCVLGALSDAQVLRDSKVDVLTDGPAFYEAELAAIRAARRSVNLEAYIFRKDAAGRRFVEALAERARAGVRVNLIVDAIGSFTTWQRTFAPLTDAGGRVRWYQPLRFSTLKRLNNRTHRELLVVDGEVGFIGGAGIADEWATGRGDDPRWRDTVVRVRGDLVIGLQTTFCENWLESAEEILTGPEYFPACPRMTRDDPGPMSGEPAQRNEDDDDDDDNDDGGDDDGDGDDVAGFVVISTPSAARSTRARVLFQTLLASAKHTIHINSPYFLPDRSVRRELVRAVERGVAVKVVVPGDHSDHLMTRRASRRRFGELLQGGCEIHEYEPSMIHVKSLVVDGVWSVVGSTNFDNRSFGLNDEVNLAAQSRALAARLAADFQQDLQRSHRVTYDAWRRRSAWEKFMETLGSLIDRQQ